MVFNKNSKSLLGKRPMNSIKNSENPKKKHKIVNHGEILSILSNILDHKFYTRGNGNDTDIMKLINSIKEGIFTINIAGLQSAGKSTLVNSMIDEIENKTEGAKMCTQCPIEIIMSPEYDHPRYFIKHENDEIEITDCDKCSSIEENVEHCLLGKLSTRNMRRNGRRMGTCIIWTY